MTLLSGLWFAAGFAALVLSLRSASVLRGRSPATIAGWLSTAAYVAIVGIAALRGRHAPAHLDGIALGVLVIAFVVAGVRDEPQAEPWWWPRAAGLTGAERRAGR